MRFTFSSLCLALCLAFTFAMPVRAATLHVALGVLPAIPATQQFRSIGEATQKVAAGDVVLIHSGTYRESIVIEKSGTRAQPIRFQAAPAASVIVTGADRLMQWRREENTGGENIYSAAWPHRFITWNPNGTHPDDDEHRMIGRAEQVFINEYPLLQVLSRSQLTRGTFFVDLDAGRLYVQASNNQKIEGEPSFMPRVEAGVRGTVWESTGDYVQVRGLRFRYAANQAQSGAAQFKGNFNVVEDCTFERMNSIGASFTGQDIVVRGCTFQDNGQMGWGAARAHRLLMTGCLTTRNNGKNWSRGWEAGGDKIVLSRDVRIQQSTFAANRGIGIWFDIGNENPTVRNCLIADNEDAGIFYEISYGLRAHDNVIIGNGLAGNGGAWGANGGISLSSSPGCVIERNILVGNAEGFNFREQGRRTPRIDAPDNAPEVWIWNHDQTIRNNVLAANLNAQLRGWFDVNDERHWPKTMQENTISANADQPAADVAAEYRAKDNGGEPKGLSLETLKLNLSNNLYAPSDAGALWAWGTEWKRNKKYANLNEVRRELGLEQNSIVAPFVLGDYLTRDFRVPANSPAIKMGAYPRGEVPGVRLGTLPNSR